MLDMSLQILHPTVSPSHCPLEPGKGLYISKGQVPHTMPDIGNYLTNICWKNKYMNQ